LDAAPTAEADEFQGFARRSGEGECLSVYRKAEMGENRDTVRDEEYWGNIVRRMEYWTRVAQQLPPWSNIDTGRSSCPSSGRGMEISVS